MKGINSDPFDDIENIMKSIDNLDKDRLKNLLSILIKIYIIDRGIGYDGEVSDNTSYQYPAKNAGGLLNDKIAAFADLIADLKQKYDFTELDNFIIEDKMVFLISDGRRMMISGKEIDSSADRIKSDNDTQNKNNPFPQDRFKNIEMDK